MGTPEEPLDVPCLIDTGACQTFIRLNVAEKLWSIHGRPRLVQRAGVKYSSITGHQVGHLGLTEVLIDGVGPMQCMVATNAFPYDMILGWDPLQRYTFLLGQTFLRLGNGTFMVDCVQGNPSTPMTLTVDAITATFSPMDALLREYRDLFGQPGTLAVAKVDPMQVEVEGPPVHQRPYPMPHRKRAAADEEIDKMLKLGVIRPSSSPYASPILLVPKKDGTIRFCIDYRKLNAVTIKDRWPLPRIQDIFDQLGGSRFFSTLDMRSGYWQVPLAPDAIAKSAFICHRGQYEWVRMPFGLANARVITKG